MWGVVVRVGEGIAVLNRPTDAIPWGLKKSKTINVPCSTGEREAYEGLGLDSPASLPRVTLEFIFW